MEKEHRHMTTLQTPSTVEEIITRVTPMIRAHADAGETNRRLAPEAVAAMIEAGAG
jgi:hypothetical protein